MHAVARGNASSMHRRAQATIAVAAVAITATASWFATERGMSPFTGAGGDDATDESARAATARDQWIDLRGGAPARRTAMAPPDRRLDVRTLMLRQERLDGAHRVFRERPDGYRPVAIVLHATGSGAPGSGFESLAELHRFLARPSARASAHFGIDRDGRILQLVDVDDAAFHVATPGWNDVSIGIELLNDNSGREPYPPAQLAALTQLVRTLGAQFGIPVEGVVRHATIQPRDRRDPVAFPWRRWLATLR